MSNEESNVISLAWQRKERVKRKRKQPPTTGDLQAQVDKLLAIVHDLEVTLRVHRRMIRKLTRLLAATKIEEPNDG